jgi:NADH dehydrogenase
MQQGRYVARLIKEEAASTEPPAREPFHYVDKGSMATIGRSRAIAWARGIKMKGFIAWLAWLFVHVFYLIGFRNRIAVLLNWMWSYVSYQRGARLITSTGWRPTAARRLECVVPELPVGVPHVPAIPERKPESVRARQAGALPSALSHR